MLLRSMSLMSSEESVSLATKSDSYSSTRVHVLVLVGRARRLTAERVARPFIVVEGFGSLSDASEDSPMSKRLNQGGRAVNFSA